MIEKILKGGYSKMTAIKDNMLAEDCFLAFDVKQLSERLGVSTRFVYKILKSGELRGRRIGRRWRVTPQNVKVFLNGMSTAA